MLRTYVYPCMSFPTVLTSGNAGIGDLCLVFHRSTQSNGTLHIDSSIRSRSIQKLRSMTKNSDLKVRYISLEVMKDMPRMSTGPVSSQTAKIMMKVGIASQFSLDERTISSSALFLLLSLTSDRPIPPPLHPPQQLSFPHPDPLRHNPQSSFIKHKPVPRTRNCLLPILRLTIHFHSSSRRPLKLTSISLYYPTITPSSYSLYPVACYRTSGAKQQAINWKESITVFEFSAEM